MISTQSFDNRCATALDAPVARQWLRGKLTWEGKTLFQSTGESTLVFDGKTLNVSAESISEVRHAFGGDVLLCVNGKKILTKSENGVSVLWPRNVSPVTFSVSRGVSHNMSYKENSL